MDFDIRIRLRLMENDTYVVFIARCRVQYGKYFPIFSYFAIYNNKISHMRSNNKI